ncbi:unnamed protein product [Lepeophtheirus salmonis]|uniref:(salmon louse) hypothetical protein n=1 Tax=Lepeophtheirus salmonis TaxID=72036 RepID=A0A7R8H193_LEPSM|nr:unnamed protein product [Lepeophtheirus salmonis]CAF2802992.1 unnamed protein product [Lepeophtheirus salmonis]
MNTLTINSASNNDTNPTQTSSPQRTETFPAYEIHGDFHAWQTQALIILRFEGVDDKHTVGLVKTIVRSLDETTAFRTQGAIENMLQSLMKNGNPLEKIDSLEEFMGQIDRQFNKIGQGISLSLDNCITQQLQHSDETFINSLLSGIKDRKVAEQGYIKLEATPDLTYNQFLNIATTIENGIRRGDIEYRKKMGVGNRDLIGVMRVEKKKWKLAGIKTTEDTQGGGANRKRSWRFAKDYRDLNSITKSDAYPIAHSIELLTDPQIGKAKYFVSVDMAGAYYPGESTGSGHSVYSLDRRNGKQSKQSYVPRDKTLEYSPHREILPPNPDHQTPNRPTPKKRLNLFLKVAQQKKSLSGTFRINDWSPTFKKGQNGPTLKGPTKCRAPEFVLTNYRRYNFEHCHILFTSSIFTISSRSVQCISKCLGLSTIENVHLKRTLIQIHDIATCFLYLGKYGWDNVYVIGKQWHPLLH